DNEMTSLNVSGLANLTSLTSKNNDFTSLDVSTNKKLNRLDIAGCASLASLTATKLALTYLDVSGCSALETLNCSNNSINRLLLAGCTGLKDLRCFMNALDDTRTGNVYYGLDVSTCSALETLWCYNNTLTSIDVSNNPNLVTLNMTGCLCSSLALPENGKLKNLYCSSNRLQSLDLSACPEIASVVCFTNELTSLNVSGCDGLTSLNCHDNPIQSLDVAGLANLGTLFANECQLTELDLTGCTALGTLWLNGNPVSSLSLEACPNLALLNLEGCENLTELDASGAKIYRLVATGCSSLESIDLSNNAPKESYYKNSIIIALSCPALQTIDASNTPVKTVQATNSASLAELNLSGNEILERVEVDSNVQRIIAESAKDVAVAVSKSDAWTGATVVDGTGAPIETAASSDAITFTVAESAASPVTVTYLDASGAAVGQTVIEGEQATPAVDTPDVSATVVGTTVKVNISSVDNAKLYRLQYSKDPTFRTVKTATFSKGGVKAITGLAENTTYYFRVKATGDGVNYVDSDWALFEATTEEAVIELAKPTVSTAVTKTAVVLKIGAVENGSKYLVEYSDDPTFATYSTKTFNAGVRTITKLESDSTYYFRVKALAPSEGYADSEWTNVSATTKPAFLAAPAVTVAPTGSTSFSVKIQAVSAATSYTVEYAKNADFSDAVSLRYTTVGTKKITDLNVDTTYYVRVCASAAGYANSDWTAAEVKTDAGLPQLDSPALTVVATAGKSVTLNIGSVDSAKTYTLQYSTSSTFASVKTVTYATAGNKTVSGLTSGKTYYFRVHANASGHTSSTWSKISAETAAASNVVLDAFAGYGEEDEFELFSTLN
ncbi:MAG: hypothetical protein IIY32_07170, partial [Thermoguttaceae bacterium]|nr:hypothetical protein [Thermoguttaceae bacterium]